MKILAAAVLSLLIAGILFCTLSMACDRILAGEVYGAVYGFPEPWHANGATSLARTVLVSKLWISVGCYVAAGVLLAALLRRLVVRTQRSRVVLAVALTLGFLAAGVPFAAAFIKPDFITEPHWLTSSATRCRPYIGPFFND